MTKDHHEIKIAFVISHTSHSLQWEWFLSRLKQNATVFFIILTNEKDLNKIILYENLKKMGVHVKLIRVSNFLSYPFVVIKLFLFLIRHRVDIVQTEMPHGNLLGLLAGFIAGKKRVMTASNVTWYKDFKSKKQWIIDRFSYSMAHKIICQAQTSADILTKEFTVPIKKVKIIYHAIDSEKYLHIKEEEVEYLRKKYNVQKNDFVFGMIARLEHWKGHEYAIRAIKQITNQHHNAKLLIFGEGPEQEKIQNLITDLRLGKHVFLCGFEKNIIPLYKLFDVQVHLPIDPYCETFGITIIDGMMMKRPFILTLSGIAHEIARDGYNALVVPFKDETKTATAMLHLISSKELRNYIGENAHKTIVRNFSIQQKVNNHLQIYSSLLSLN